MTSQSFRNPYDISRAGLLDQLARMRTNFLHATPTTPNLVEDGVCALYLFIFSSSLPLLSPLLSLSLSLSLLLSHPHFLSLTFELSVICALCISYLSPVVRHQVPIGQMGNYQEHLKRINPLREVDSGSVRTQLFGNPYKLERPTDNKVMVSHYSCFNITTL